MWITSRVGRNTYISTGIGFWILGGIAAVAATATIIVLGLFGVGVILLASHMLRRWNWLWIFGLVFGVGFIGKWNLNIIRAYDGSTGIWTAALLDVLILASLVALGTAIAREQSQSR